MRTILKMLFWLVFVFTMIGLTACCIIFGTLMEIPEVCKLGKITSAFGFFGLYKLLTTE